MKTTLYVPDEKVALYERAKEELGESLSSTFIKCLERELAMRKLKTERIVVEVTDRQTDRSTKKAFQGRWLVASDRQPEQFWFEGGGASGSGFYAVAQSAKGTLVVLSGENDEEWNELTYHGDFDDFKDAKDGVYSRYPDSLIAAVAEELDLDYAEELDI
jgi:hypothetical protein